MNLFVVFLRRPRDLDDRRSDPFWEFGSFGSTGCHSRNLLHPEHCQIQNGDRLVFLQGGKAEIRAIALTPPVSVAQAEGHIEIIWNRRYRPLPYEQAPLLINNAGISDFPAVHHILADTSRSTYCGAAGSRFRSFTKPLEPALATQIQRWFDTPGLPKARHYIDAIAPTSDRWHDEAANQGWSAKSLRESLYTGKQGTRSCR